jgi:hypothetical protein
LAFTMPERHNNIWLIVQVIYEMRTDPSGLGWQGFECSAGPEIRKGGNKSRVSPVL